jgi:hypothetical protein
MEETYTVCGGLQVAGKMNGETVTRSELEAARCTDGNISSLIVAGLIELTELSVKPAKSTAKAKTGE